MHPQFTPKQIARFWAQVSKAGICWIWRGQVHRGYGRFSARQGGKLRNVGAHRLSYLLLRGPIPDGLCVLHNCPDGDNPLCVNPAHLWLGTNTDNIADREQKGRTASGKRNGRHTHPERFGDEWRAKVSARSYDNQRGALHPSAKLTEHDVREIRRRRTAGEQLKPLAAEFGVSFALIWMITKRKAWRHI